MAGEPEEVRSEVRKQTIEGQNSLVRLEQARLDTSLLLAQTKKLTIMTKSRPRKKQSERSDLPYAFLAT